MEQEDKDFFKRVFSMMVMTAIFSILIYGMISFKSYVLHIPKDIQNFTYDNNELSFNLEKDENNYKLKLPTGTLISPNDKLSIVLINEYHSKPNNVNVRAASFTYDQKKEINFFINNKLTYNLNNNIELTYTFRDPATGLVVEKVFN